MQVENADAALSAARAAEPPATRTPALRLSHVNKRFGSRRDPGVMAIDDTSMTVEQGEFVVLLGPSGCGKTTLLRCVAGLEQPDSGQIEIGGEAFFSSASGRAAGAEDRGISMMFQSYALWPHMSAFKNVAYPLTIRRRSRPAKDEVERRVRRILDLVGVSHVAHHYPHQMSGGQQQRVALARALVGGSQLVLFDEPLSNVDARARDQLRAEMITMQREIGFAAVYVTHDQSEALQLADRIAVIHSGRVLQFDSPHVIYTAPASRLVANLVGTVNELPGRLEAAADGSYVVSTEVGSVVARNCAPDAAVGDQVVACWRPERGVLTAAGAAGAAGAAPPTTSTTPTAPAAVPPPAGGANQWSVTVELSQFGGNTVDTRLRLGPALQVRHFAAGTNPLAGGSAATLRVPPADVRVLPA